MKAKHRVLAAGMAAAMTLSLAACGGSASTAEPTASSTVEAAAPEATSEAASGDVTEVLKCFLEALRRWTRRLRALGTCLYLCQKLLLVKCLIIRYLVIPYLQGQRNHLKMRIQFQFLRQIHAAVTNNFI